MINYIQTFLNTAHRTRFATEPIEYPRTKQLLRPSDETIDEGYRIFNSKKFGLEKFLYRDGDDKIKGRFKANIFRKDSAKADKKWTLTTYTDDTYVQFIQIDLDRHGYEHHETPDDRKQADHEFFSEVQNLLEIADDLHFDIVWTTSPGNVLTTGIFKGELVQGLYAWIKLSNPVQVHNLRSLMPVFKEYYNVNAEICWDDTNGLLRLGGQRHVEVVDPLTFAPAYPYDDTRPQDTLNGYNQDWINAQPVDIDALFNPAIEWKKKQTRPVVSKPKRKGNKLHLNNDQEFLKDLRSIRNTFDRTVKVDKLFSHLTWNARPKAHSKDEAPDYSTFPAQCEKAKERMIETMFPGSETCSKPRMLSRFVEDKLRWFYKRFDPSKSSNNRMHVRRKEDEHRFVSSSKDKHGFLALCKERCACSYKELTRLSAFFDDYMKHTGRLDYKLCHSIFAGKRNWDKMQKRLRDAKLLFTLDEYDRTDAKCRQYGIAVCDKQQKQTKLGQGFAFPRQTDTLLESISCTSSFFRRKNKTDSICFDGDAYSHWREAIKRTDISLTFEEQVKQMRSN